MKELLVINKDNNRYILMDKESNKYDLTIYIEDEKYQIDTGDILTINIDMIDTRVLTFGNINSKYGRDINETNYSEVVTFNKNGNKTYLKRIYG